LEPPESARKAQQSSIPQTVSEGVKPVESTGLRALYLFAGMKRKSDIACFLKKSGWYIDELDILRSKDHDLTKQHLRTELLHQIHSGKYKAVLASPPCNTFSRVKFANTLGPVPTRSFTHPRGFSWLTGNLKKSAELANILVDFTFEVVEAQAKTTPGLVIVEFPEDLGAMTAGKWQGIRPASIWQWPQLQNLLKDPSFWTAGLKQQDFGTEYLKPTRLLLRLDDTHDQRLFRGLPQFDDDGIYLGPIPKGFSNWSLAKKPGDTAFRTAGTAAWPPGLCKFLSDQLNETIQNKHTELIDSVLDAPSVPVALVGTVTKDAGGGNFWKGGIGQPRQTFSAGKSKPFHDGAGLTSPGRWKKEDRRFPEGENFDSLRTKLKSILDKALSPAEIQKAFFAIIAKRDPFKTEWLEAGRIVIANWIKEQSWFDTAGVEDLTTTTPGQPFCLKLLHGCLKAFKDADADILPVYMEGVPLGILKDIKGNRAIFEAKSKWKLSMDPLCPPELENPNYGSLADHLEEVERQFREEEQEGLMKEFTNEDFKASFGDNTAISALSVIEEPGKVRVLLDATHITQVNNRIRVPDQICVPGVRELHTLLNEYKDLGTTPLALLADISKAHRRYKHAEAELGFLSCRLREHTVWVNLCGTFGVACTAYWWSRLMGALVRCTYGLLGKAHPIELLTYVDDLLFLSGSKEERYATVFAIFIFRLFGLPFKAQKFRGGFKVDWIGLHLCCKTFAVGLSPDRAAWMVQWIQKVLANGWVATCDMAMALGRLNFAITALIFEKPFLGILYMWTSTIIRSTKKVATLPWAVRLVLQWICERFTASDGMQRVLPPPIETEDWFRSDAKAEDGRATIGGWECKGGVHPSQARWFFVEVTADWAPWAFSKQGDPKRVIATLELLGTILCLHLFKNEYHPGDSGYVNVAGGTDNAGNTFAMKKLMSTKWPLTVLLIELAEISRQNAIQLHLRWVPRDSNQEADDLTNQKFGAFNPELRVECVPAKIDWLVLPRIMCQSQRLYEEVLEQRELQKSSSVPHVCWIPAKKRKRKDPW
jgi:hypothetical protein